MRSGAQEHAAEWGEGGCHRKREKEGSERERERRARVERDRENSEKDGRKIKIIRRIEIN